MKQRILALLTAFSLMGGNALAIDTLAPTSSGTITINNSNSSLLNPLNAVGSQINLNSLTSGIVIDLFQPGKLETLTVSGFGQTVVMTYQPFYWTFNGRLAQTTTTAKRYDRNGILTNAVGTTFYYDSNGRPAKGKTHMTYTSTFQYDAKSRKKSENTTYTTYDLFRIVQRMTDSQTFAYNTNGTLARKERNYRTTGADGKVINDASGRVVDVYTYRLTGDVIQTHDVYELSGKLRTKTADLTVVDGAVTRKYSVSYDLNASGNVTYTHTYAAEEGAYVPVDIPELSGAGFRDATQILDDLKDLLAPAYLNIQGDVVFSSAKTWDFSKFNLQVSGSLTVGSEPNGYDIYVTGDLQLTKGTMDLKGLKLYVSGNIGISPDATLLMDSASHVVVGGSFGPITLGQSFSAPIGGDLSWVTERNAVIQVQQTSSQPQQNIQFSGSQSVGQSFSIAGQNNTAN